MCCPYNLGRFISNLGLFLYLFFLTVQVRPSLVFGAGLFCYPLGLGLCALAVISFAFPDDTGFNATGLYRFSRNPMYMAYFICFVGMALLTQSPLLLGIVLIFQFSAHWIVLAEERWCLEKFVKTRSGGTSEAISSPQERQPSRPEGCLCSIRWLWP